MSKTPQHPYIQTDLYGSPYDVRSVAKDHIPPSTDNSPLTGSKIRTPFKERPPRDKKFHLQKRDSVDYKELKQGWEELWGFVPEQRMSPCTHDRNIESQRGAEQSHETHSSEQKCRARLPECYVCIVKTNHLLETSLHIDRAKDTDKRRSQGKSRQGHEGSCEMRVSTRRYAFRSRSRLQDNG